MRRVPNGTAHIMEASLSLQFLHQRLQVHLVPTLHDLVAFHDQEGGSLQASLPARGREPEMVAQVGHRYPPANGYTIAFSDNILHVDVEIRESPAKRAMDSLERLGTYENRIRIRKAVGLALRVKHFINRGFALLVPDLLKPAPQEKFVGVRHGTLQCAESIAFNPA